MKFPASLKDLREAPYIDGEITLEAEYPRQYIAYVRLDWIPPICHKNLTTLAGDARQMLSELRHEFWHVLRDPATGKHVSRTPDTEAWQA